MSLDIIGLYIRRGGFDFWFMVTSISIGIGLIDGGDEMGWDGLGCFIGGAGIGSFLLNCFFTGK